MLAYVFWHWRNASCDPADYQNDLRSFHEVLAAQKPAGFLKSSVFEAASLPWIDSGQSEVYEDWYLVENSAALDPLDHAAVNGQRKGPHDQVAQWAAGGTGGLYRLRAGQADSPPAQAFWFAKPSGMSYTTLYTILEEQISRHAGSFWQRQMTMSPALEFCWHAPPSAQLPEELVAVNVPLTIHWQG